VKRLADPRRLPLAKPGFWGRQWWLFKRSFVGSYEDGQLGYAKGAAYSALLAFFPVLTSLTTILVQANAAAVSQTLAEFLFEVVPPGSEELLLYTVTARGEQPISLIVVASLVSVWAASGVMMSLMEGFRAAYKIPSGRSFLEQRGVAAMLVFCSALPAVGASALIMFGGRTEQTLMRWAGLLAVGEQLRGSVAVLGQVTRYTIAFATVMLVAALLYHFGPNRPRRFGSVWPGAFMATLLWLLATMGFAWYVRNIANYNVLYGSIGAVIALIVWMYFMAVIALLGCEFNAERDRLLTALA
jgi:membrane protein